MNKVNISKSIYPQPMTAYIDRTSVGSFASISHEHRATNGEYSTLLFMAKVLPQPLGTLILPQKLGRPEYVVYKRLMQPQPPRRPSTTIDNRKQQRYYAYRASIFFFVIMYSMKVSLPGSYYCRTAVILLTVRVCPLFHQIRL